MPYDLKTRSGVILRNIPDDVSQDDPRLKALAAQMAGGQDVPAPAAPRDALAEFDPTEGMSKTEKVLANVGAGMADLIHGGRQRFAEWTGDDDTARALREETAEKRRRDKHLAGKTTGGGALQIAGKALPLTVAAFLPGGQTIAGGALAGGVGGALETTDEDESVLKNVAFGTALGAALPAAMKGYRGFQNWRTGGVSERRAAEEIAKQMGKEGAPVTREALEEMLPQLDEAARANNIASILGKGDPQRAAVLQAAEAGEHIPLSTAARTQNPSIARLEQASRIRSPEQWVDFDERHARALSDAVKTATNEAGELVARKGARKAAYNAAGEAFDQAVDPGKFTSEVQALRQATEQALKGPEAVNKSVKAALNEVLEQLDNEALTPAHMRQLRVELVSKLDQANPLRAAPRDNPAIIGIKNQIDDLLNRVSGDAYTPINKAYAEGSREVAASRAAQEVRNAFYDPVNGLAVRGAARDALGEIPTITEAGLNKVIQNATDDTGKTLLSPQGRKGLDQTLEAIRKQNIVQRLKRAGSAGGGSDTAQNFTALAQDEAGAALLDRIGKGSVTAKVLSGGVKAVDALLNAKRDQIIAEAARDPARLAGLLRTLEQASPEVKRTFMERLAAQMRLPSAGSDYVGALGRGAVAPVGLDLAEDNE